MRMKSNTIDKDYFWWLMDIIGDYDDRMYQFSNLCEELYSYEFIWNDADPNTCFDKNRAGDGLQLRREYVEQHAGMTMVDLNHQLWTPNCTVLEMMIALCKRIENEMLGNWFDSHNHMFDWFYDMLQSLGISDMTNGSVDHYVVQNVVRKLLKRQYHKDGSGGLFTVAKSCKNVDMRKIELWYQANLWSQQVTFG